MKVLSLLLCFGLAAPAFAADNGVVDLSENAGGAAPAGAVAQWKEVEKLLGTDKAADALDNYLKKHPHGELAARAGVERARIEENLEKALEYYEAAGKADPDGVWGARAILELGKSEYAIGSYEKALLHFDTMLLDESTASLEPEYLYWKAQTRFVLMGVKRARREFGTMIEKYPKHPLAAPARLGAAECAVALGELDTAYKEFLELDGKDSSVGAQALWQAAQVQEKKGNPATALKHYRTLTERFPNAFETTQARKKLAGTPLAKAAPSPTPDKSTVAYYSIQLGAFIHNKGAQTLKEKVEKKKLTVVVKKVDVRGQTYHVVRVGRFPEKEAAERFAKDLKKREGWSYRVVEEP